MDYIDLVKTLWADMISSPWVAIFGISVLCLILFRKQLQNWLDKKINSEDTKGINHKNYYTRNDLYNHSIFKDLDYWLTTGIELVKIEKSYAKELIMKDLLVIKFTIIKDILRSFMEKEKIEEMSLEKLKADIFSLFREVNSKKVIGWRNSGIPEIFITKYLSMQSLSSELVFDTLKVFLSKNIQADNFTRCYLILSVIETHLANIYATAVNTALSLNGDLNGMVYKGVIIGKNNTCYAVPNPISKSLIEEKLNSLLVKSKASRATVFLFHDYPEEDIFSGKFSIIYEVCAPGIKEEREVVQFIPAYLIAEYEPYFKTQQVCIKDKDELNYELRELFSNQGTEKVVTYPLMDNGSIKGFIGLSWDYLERFDRDSKSIIFGELLKTVSQEVRKLILGR